MTGAATDSDGHAVSYSWDLDGDGVFETQTQNASTTFNQAGTFTPTLRVTDQFGGAATRAVPVTVLSATTDPSKDYNVLVFSRTAAFRHSSIDEGITAIKLLGEQHNFGVDAIEEPSLFTDEFLSRYDAVIWLSTTGDVLNDTQQAAFERYIRADNGYVGIHAAADTEYGWPWYGKLVGGVLPQPPERHADRDGRQGGSDARLHGAPAGALDACGRVVQLPLTPVVDMSTAAFSPRNNPVHVLLRMDESTYNESDGNSVDDDHPISWCQRYDGGRSWYTGMAHTEASFVDPTFLQHLLAGIEVASGNTPDDTCGVVSREGGAGGSVAATLSLTLGSAASFGTFVPGVARNYDASTTANVISTAGDALLSVADPSPTATGRLVNGSFALAQPLQAMGTSASATGGAFASLSTDTSPLDLLTYTGPVSNDAASITFRQSIAANDALRTGAYSKTLTFTLSTTTP